MSMFGKETLRIPESSTKKQAKLNQTDNLTEHEKFKREMNRRANFE